jgi:hypothetical protein
MNSSFKPRTLVSIILPGFVLLIAVAYLLVKGDIKQIDASVSAISTLTSAGVITTFFLVAFCVGAFIDAIRNSLDSLFDRYFSKDKDTTWWDIFFKGDKEKVEQLDEYYYSYYQFDANLAIVSFILSLLFLFFNPSPYRCIFLIPAAICAVLLLDAILLRKEIKRLSQEHLNCPVESLPHDQSYTRLKPSSVCDGVGVFAIKSIKKGSPVFPDDTAEIVWVDKEKIEQANLTEVDKRLYRDFVIFKSDKCGCPANFDSLTVSWYLNEPKNGDEPNVKCDIAGGYKFYAAREISEGEELTAHYSEYSLDSWI